MVIENKLGLTDSLELAKQEEKLSKEKAKRLFEENLLADKVASEIEINVHQEIVIRVLAIARAVTQGFNGGLDDVP